MLRKLFICLLWLPFFACTKAEDPNEGRLIEVSLYTGIPGIAKLGDTRATVLKNAQFASSDINPSDDPSMKDLNFSEGLSFPSIGTRVYFRRNGAAMITIQEPFRGFIKGKKIRLFAFTVPPVKHWDELIMKELGPSETRASGGRFSSESLFYNWGDISFNKMGPNQLSLYRDSEIAKFRQSNFGRELTLFPSK